MPVWWSVIIYMLFVSALGMKMYSNSKKKAVNQINNEINNTDINSSQSISFIFAILSFALLVFFVGQRSYIFDSSEYQYAFNGEARGINQFFSILFDFNNSKGSAFSALMVLFKSIFPYAQYNDWFTFLAIIQVLLLARTMHKYSCNYVLSIYFFMTMSYFVWMLNGTRQFTAVCVVFGFIDLLVEKKGIKFFIVVFIAFLFHSSAIIWLPVYFCMMFDEWSVKFIIVSACIVIALFIFLKNQNSDSNYFYLIENAYSNGVNPIRVLISAIPVVLSFIRKDKITQTAPYFIRCFIKFAIITTEIYILTIFVSAVVGRIVAFLSIFQILLLPWLLKYAFNEAERKILSLLLVILYFLYFIYDMYVAGNGIYNSRNLNLLFL